MNADLAKQAEELSAELYTTDTVLDETTEGEVVYLLSHPELPGCMAQGRTIDEARDNLVDARKEYILSLLEDKEPVPLPKYKLTMTSAGHSYIDIGGYAGQPPQILSDDLPKRRTHLGTVSPVEVG